MLPVFYPSSRFKENLSAYKSMSEKFTTATKRTVLELRDSPRSNDHKFRSLAINGLWISDIAGRKGGRLLYFRKNNQLIIWGLGSDHKIEEEADRYFDNVSKEDFILNGDLVDVTANFLSENEENEIKEKTKVFAGNLSDEFLQTHLLMTDYQISELRKSNKLSLWNLSCIDEICRFKLTQYLKMPENVLLSAKDETHLLGFINGSKEKLMIHLDDYQEKIVDLEFKGSYLLRGETGSGKTTILIYKAIYYAESNPDKDCILFTFNLSLANMIKEAIEDLAGETIKNLKIYGIYEYLLELSGLYLVDYDLLEHKNKINVYDLFADFYDKKDKKSLNFSADSDFSFFLKKEIEEVILEFGISDLSRYLSCKRNGTDKKLGKNQRKIVWSAYQKFMSYLDENKLISYKSMLIKIIPEIMQADFPFRYDAIFTDEVQDLAPVIIKIISYLRKDKDSPVVFAGDYKQAIYRKSFSWSDVRLPFYGQNVLILNKNYRNTVQILNEAHKLSTLFDIPWKKPISCGRQGREVQRVYYQGKEKIQKLKGLIEYLCIDEGIDYSDIAVFAPSKRVEKLVDALTEVDIPAVYIKNNDAHYKKNAVKVSTLHSAKGLEFRVVILIDIEKDLLKLKYDNERLKIMVAVKLLYVGMTRAYDCLFFFLQEGVETNKILQEFLYTKEESE